MSDVQSTENFNAASASQEKNVAQDQMLQEELQSCRMGLEELKDKYARLSSDFDNFKRRTSREQVQWSELAQAKLINDVLEIVDDFDRAFEVSNTSDAKELLTGFELIRTALHKTLTKWGVEQMNNYQEFNPEFHEALGQMPSADHVSGQIVQILQQGYLFKGNVLRPARVMVAQ